MTAHNPRLDALSCALLIALLAGGCQQSPVEAALPWDVVDGALSRLPPSAPVRRVLVLPFTAGEAPPSHPALMQAAFAQALRATCGFEVVAPDAFELPRTSREELLAGRTRDLASLIRLHREWGCDAILAGRVAFSRAHGEPAAGLELSLVDARDGSLLWTARDAIDSRVPATRHSLLRFRGDEGAEGADPVDTSQVPAECFARFIAASFIRTLYPAAGIEFPEPIAPPVR
ncbi:MAG: hypothetical protein EXS13_06965 [Planctomycetes bacterium]|nr:hypothetical protein [Planctomycetota bacterium]